MANCCLVTYGWAVGAGAGAHRHDVPVGDFAAEVRQSLGDLQGLLLKIATHGRAVQTVLRHQAGGDAALQRKQLLGRWECGWMRRARPEDVIMVMNVAAR